MSDGQQILERAFQLASEGLCRSVSDIRRKLKQEGFDAVEAHLSGPSIVRQLKARLEAQREVRSEQPAEA